MSTSAVNPPPRNFGTVISAKFEDLKNFVFPRINTLNPRSRIACILRETEEDIKKVFQLAFDNFNILRIIGFSISASNDLKCCTYDAFVTKNLVCRVLTEENYEKEMKELMYFMRLRYINLNGNKMKVISREKKN